MKGKFQHQLEKLVLHKIIVLISVGVVMFLLGMMAITYYANEHNARKNMDMLCRSFEEAYHSSEEFLMNEAVQEACFKAITGKLDVEQLSYVLRRYLSGKNVKSHLILTDHDGKLYYSTFHEEDITGYLLNYNGAVCFHAGEGKSERIYNSVYYKPGSYSDYIFVKPLRKEGELIGYLSLYLSGSDWNYILSENNYDGVMTDSRNNIIYCSKASFMNNHGKFHPDSGRFLYMSGERYWMIEKTLPAYDVTVYSMVYDPRSPVWLVGILIVCIMGILWYGLAKSMSDSMAANNAEMINRLVSEIRVIQMGNSNYRIEKVMDNEFDEVSHQINHMLDSIQNLNEKNMELVRLNNTFELNQLMAQINPHFLYNTLEMIRNLVMWDQEKTSSLILKLTQILRYSIDRNRQMVHLKEDISYLMDYIDIQKCRFNTRFVCDIDIAPECMQCMVPKLIIQPIVENSIKYGFQKKMEISVWIRGYMETGVLRLVVEDDGPGMASEEAEWLNYSIRQVYKDTSSFGLHNISRRLYLQYGKESGVTVYSEQGEGMTVVVSIAQEGELGCIG